MTFVVVAQTLKCLIVGRYCVHGVANLNWCQGWRGSRVFQKVAPMDILLCQCVLEGIGVIVEDVYKLETISTTEVESKSGRYKDVLACSAGAYKQLEVLTERISVEETGRSCDATVSGALVRKDVCLGTCFFSTGPRSVV